MITFEPAGVDLAAQVPAGPPTSRPVARAVGVGLPFAVPALAMLVVAVFARRVDPDAVGDLGLVTVIPVPVLAAASALSVSFAASVLAAGPKPSRLRTAGLVAHLLALVVVLHGLAGLLEAEPRFPTAWLHAGFVDALREYGRPVPGVDARFSWPGFFAAAASFVGAAGLSSALPLLRFAPVAANLAYLLPLGMIARALVPSVAGRWAVAWLFLLGNWVGQDYFSPQAVGYFVFLAILALVVTTLGSSRPRAAAAPRRPRSVVAGAIARSSGAGWVRRLSDAAEPAASPASRGATWGALVAVVVGFTALCVAHQLTPVVLVVDVAALVLVRRCSVRLLPVALGAILLGWISYGAADFWMGHLSSLLGGGSVSSSVGSNVTGRVHGSAGHLVVVGVRLLVSAAVWGLAAAGAWSLVRARRPFPLPAAALAVAPFPILAVQSYGGEAQLRLYLFTLPFMLCLAVRLFVPGAVLKPQGAIALAAVAVIATQAFYVARFGNEQFEQVRTGEVAAVAELYRIAPPGAALVAISPNLPWRYRAFADYEYRPTTPDEFALDSEAAILALMPPNPRGSFLVITRGQTAYATTTYGLTADYDRRIEALLRSSPRFRLRYANADASVYQLVPERQP